MVDLNLNVSSQVQLYQQFIKSKGLSNLKTFIEFDNIIQNKVFKYTKMTKFKESLKRKMSFNEMI
jgi:hypothetical protein